MSMETWKPRRFVEEFQKRAGLFVDGIPGPQTQMALELLPHMPPGILFPPAKDAPTPIDPADIRPGDVVEIRQRVAVGYVKDGCVYDATGFGPWNFGFPGCTAHLIERPDPDAEAVEALGDAFRDGFDIELGEAKEPFSEKILHALREQGWDVTRRKP